MHSVMSSIRCNNTDSKVKELWMQTDTLGSDFWALAGVWIAWTCSQVGWKTTWNNCFHSNSGAISEGPHTSCEILSASATFAVSELPVAAMKLSFCIRKVLGRMTGNGWLDQTVSHSTQEGLCFYVRDQRTKAADMGEWIIWELIPSVIIFVVHFLPRVRQDGVVQSAQPVPQARSPRLSQLVSIASFKKRLQ